MAQGPRHAAAVDARLDDGSTPLIHATEMQHTAIVELLLIHGALAAHKRACDGLSALNIAQAKRKKHGDDSRPVC